jgi:diguanylate cyclase (GGDEF)-like protein
VLLIDLDHFKSVNDRLGHMAGDRVLCEVAASLRQAAGAEAFVSRYAGDEFVVVLPGADVVLAWEVERNLRAAPGACLPDRRYGAGLALAASIGTAIYPEDGAEARALVNCADKRMYQDKFRRRAEANGAGGITLDGEGDDELCPDEEASVLNAPRAC